MGQKYKVRLLPSAEPHDVALHGCRANSIVCKFRGWEDSSHIQPR
jgi:hypothetical protein